MFFSFNFIEAQPKYNKSKKNKVKIQLGFILHEGKVNDLFIFSAF